MRKQIGKLGTWSRKNFLTWWEIKEDNQSFVGMKNLQNLARKTGKKTKRCIWLSSSGGYAKKELRDLCIGEKPSNLVGNWGGKPKDKLMKNLLNSMQK